MNRTKITAALVAVLCGGVLAEEAGPRTTDVLYTESSPVTLFSTTWSTTLRQMQKEIGPTMDAAEAAMSKAGIKHLGAVEFIYHGADGQPDTPIELTIGWPVDKATKPVGEYDVDELPKMKCAMTVYVGGMQNIKDAYGKMIGQLQKDGKKMTGECREIYAYWDGMDSPKTVTILQLAIQ